MKPAVLGIFLSIAVFFLSAIALSAAPVKVSVKVDGLSCPFCAYGLEKKIKKLEGVEELSINMHAGTVEVFYRDEKFFDREKLEEAVKDAGFTPKRIRKKAR